MADDPTMRPGQPYGLFGFGQDAAQAGRSPARLRRTQAASRESSQSQVGEFKASEPKASEPKVSSVNQRPKATLKQLSLRIDDGTHSKIAQAAQQANQSINAWMEEVLSEAADDTLGLGGDSTINSAAIRSLIEEPDYSKQLIEKIAPHLRDNSFATIFQFSHPLRKLLVGWDRLQPLLPPAPDPDPAAKSSPQASPYSSVVKLTDAVMLCLPTADPAAVLQFNAALKKFLLGIAAVEPFMKEDKNQSLLAVIAKIDMLIQTIEVGY